MDNKENDELLGGPNFCLKRKDVDATFSQCPSPSTAPEQSGINREKTKFHERVPPPTHTLNHKWLEVLFLFFFQQPRLTGIKIYTRYYKSSGGGGGLYIFQCGRMRIFIYKSNSILSLFRQWASLIARYHRYRSSVFCFGCHNTNIRESIAIAACEISTKIRKGKIVLFERC